MTKKKILIHNIFKSLTLSVFVFLILAITAQSAICKTITKEVEVQTKDTRIIKATISYVQIAGLKKYPTVLLLHSIGYSSKEWGKLIPELNNAGYAVIAMDLRGHGKSVYNAKFQKKSWPYFTPKVYAKFPSDAAAILTQAQQQDKYIDLNNYAIIGADIGANTAILMAKDYKKKPKTMVLISPTTNFKGLYTPIAMTSLNMPILTMTSKKDRYSLQQQAELAKFSQGGYYAQNYPQGGMGMIMIKVNPSMSQDIVKWVIKYLR